MQNASSVIWDMFGKDKSYSIENIQLNPVLFSRNNFKQGAGTHLYVLFVLYV